MASPIQHNSPPWPPPTHVHLHANTRAPWILSHAPNLTLGFLRVVAGLMFAQHGAQKLFGVLPMPNMPMPVIHPFSQLWFAGGIELIGGVLIALGLFTRVAGFIMSGEMAVAYFTVHAKRGYFPILNGGELAALYSFVFLACAGLGAGAYSLDHLIAVVRGRPRLHRP